MNLNQTEAAFPFLFFAAAAKKSNICVAPLAAAAALMAASPWRHWSWSVEKTATLVSEKKNKHMTTATIMS